VLRSSGNIEYIGNLSYEDRMEGTMAFATMFKSFVEKNPILKKGLKQLTSRSHSRRSHSQRGGGILDSEFAEEIRDTEDRIKRLRSQIEADPDNLVNAQKDFLIRDYREYINVMKKWRQFHNYIYMLSVPLLAPQFAKMLLALIIHIIAFSASTVPMAGATTYNLFISFVGHLFSPLDKLTRTMFKGAGNRELLHEQADDDTGLCRPGYRPDPSLGCVQVFTPEAGSGEAHWKLDVTRIGLDTVNAITFNLQQTLADPLHGIATVAVAAAMLWRLHMLAQYEENLFREKLERMKTAQRESVRSMSTMEQSARTAHTAALATMGPAFAQLGDGRALQMLANGIFQMSAPRQQQLLTGTQMPLLAAPAVAPMLKNREDNALAGLLALTQGQAPKVRRGSIVAGSGR